MRTHFRILHWALTCLVFMLLSACGGDSDDAGPGNPIPLPQAVPVALAIVGTGRVQSQPLAIDCTSSCNAAFAPEFVVTLTATAGAGQVFAGWAGACTNATGPCVFTMKDARSVTATFRAADVPPPVVPPALFKLSLNVSGAGSVTSQPAGITCTSNCNADFGAGIELVLTATPAANQSFTGWGGACAGAQATCNVAMNQAQTVTAIFSPVVGSNFALNVGVSGSGSVVSNPAGISCGATCGAVYPAGTTVTLTAVPAANQLFGSWSGACAGSQLTCTVQMTQIRAAQAAFVTAPVASNFLAPQLLETSNDFNVADTNLFAGANTLLAVNRNGDAIAVWEQSDGTPDGRTLKVFSRRYQAATGWQAATAVPGLATTTFGIGNATGELLLDDAGVATWIRPNMETRRNLPGSGWTAAFNPPNLRSSQDLTSAVISPNGTIAVLRSGSDVEANTLPAGGQWGTWTRLDNAGTAVSQRGQLALSSNGTALAIWRESNPGDNNYSMKAARFTLGAGWTAAESIETLFTNVFAANPRVAIDAQGNGIAMWLQGSRNTVHYNVYRVGSGWQGAVEVTGEDSLVGAARIQLSMAPDGRALATWTGNSANSGLLRSMQFSLTTGWTAPVTVDEYNVNRQVKLADNGQAIVVYSPRLGGLVTRRLSLGGTWSDATPLAIGLGSVKDTLFAMNPAGQGALIYVQDDVANSSTRNSLWASVLR